MAYGHRNTSSTNKKQQGIKAVGDACVPYAMRAGSLMLLISNVAAAPGHFCETRKHCHTRMQASTPALACPFQQVLPDLRHPHLIPHTQHPFV